MAKGPGKGSSLDELPLVVDKTELNDTILNFDNGDNNSNDNSEFHSILSYSSSLNFSSPCASSIDSLVSTSAEGRTTNSSPLCLSRGLSESGLSGRTLVVHLPAEEQIERDSATEEQLARIRREIEELEVINPEKAESTELKRRKSRRDLVKVPLESGLPVALHSNDTGKEEGTSDYEQPEEPGDFDHHHQNQSDNTPSSTANTNGQYVGMKIVDEDHRNYILMYDMLTGIRISVSRCQAKPSRPLTARDFQSTHKMAFDLTGNAETPSSRYDFKFKDYSPWVFRSLRESFGIDAADYLVSALSYFIIIIIITVLGIVDGKVCAFGIVFTGKEWQFVLLLPGLPFHHQNHPRIRTLVPPQNPFSLPPAHYKQPQFAVGPVLWVASGAVADGWKEDLLCGHGQFVPE